MLNPWLNVGLVLTVLIGLILGLRLYQRRCAPHPEVVRKLLHVVMGLLTLSFPWLFRSPLPVLILALLAVGGLLALRLYPPLQHRFGAVLGGVERRSWGELYFPIAVAVVFVLAQGDVLLYSIPILILTWADAIAAIIGVRYGQIRYATTDGQKSAEGSLAFFIATFFSVHVPLLLFSPTGRAETLLIALILAFLMMVIEAIAWQGLDNLFIPLGGLVLLRSHLSMTVWELGIRLGVTMALVVLVLSWRRRTTLTDNALLTAVLIGYLSWMVGGWRWLMPPLILFITYPLFVPWIDQRTTPLTAEERQLMLWLPNPETQSRQWQRIHSLAPVLSVCAAGLFWLFLFGLWNHSRLLDPYTLAFSANLAIVGIAGFSPVNYWHWTRGIVLLGHVLKAWGLIGLPMLAIDQFSALAILSTLVALGGTAATALLYYAVQPCLRRWSSQQGEPILWLGRAGMTLLGSSLGLLP